MEKNIVFSSILSVFGIVFMLYGVIEYFFPSKYGNGQGHKTTNSLKTPESWKFAQKYYAKNVFFTALFLLILSYFSNFFSMSDTLGFIISIAIIILLGILIHKKTEKALKNKFH